MKHLPNTVEQHEMPYPFTAVFVFPKCKNPPSYKPFCIQAHIKCFVIIYALGLQPGFYRPKLVCFF